MFVASEKKLSTLTPDRTWANNTKPKTRAQARSGQRSACPPRAGPSARTGHHPRPPASPESAGASHRDILFGSSRRHAATPSRTVVPTASSFRLLGPEQKQPETSRKTWDRRPASRRSVSAFRSAGVAGLGDEVQPRIRVHSMQIATVMKSPISPARHASVGLACLPRAISNTSAAMTSSTSTHQDPDARGLHRKAP